MINLEDVKLTEGDLIIIIGEQRVTLERFKKAFNLANMQLAKLQEELIELKKVENDPNSKS